MHAAVTGYYSGYMSKDAAEDLPSPDAAAVPVPPLKTQTLTPEEMSGAEAHPGRVYLGVRDVHIGPVTVGRHSFAVFVPKNKSLFHNELVDMGNGVQGVVVGAYALPNSLSGGKMLGAMLNHPTDYAAARAFFSAHPNESGARINPALVELPYNGKVDSALERVLQRVKNFQLRSAAKPVKYPWMGLGSNSNTFVQDLLADAGILHNKRYHFPGFAPGVQEPFDDTYFKRP